MTAFHQTRRKQIDGYPSIPGKEQEVAIRAQDRAFQRHLALHIKDFPKPNPAASGKEK